MADEVWVQALDTSAVESAAHQAADAVAALEEHLDRLTPAFGGARSAADAVAGSLGQATQTIATSTRSLDGNYSSTVRLSEAGQQYVRSAGAAGGAAGNFGNQLLTLGRLVDDSRYGLQGIANNLIEINPLLGIAAIAGGILAQRFGDIQKAAQGTSLEEPINTWKAFFDQNIQAAGEFVGLLDSAQEKASKAQTAEAAKATEAISKIKSPEQEAAGKAALDVIKRFGGGTEVTNLLQGADLVATQGAPRSAEEQRRFQERLAIDIQAATRGDQGAIERIQSLTRGAPGRAALFGQELEAQVARTSPEAVAAAKQEQERIDRESKEAAAANAQADKEAAAKKKQQNDLIDLLNKTGEENQEAGEKVAKQQDEKARREGKELASTAAGAGAGAAQISRLLQAQGIDKETADAMAATATQKTGLRAAFEDRQRSVEVYGSADYLSRVQTSVGGGGDTGQRQLQEQIAMNQKLQALLENTRKFGLSRTGEAEF